MALQDIPGGLYLPAYPTAWGSAPSLAGNVLLMDAASEGSGPICQAPKTGNIAKIGFRVQTVTSAPSSNHTISIQGVTAAGGFRDGTPLGGGSPASTTALLDSTGWKLITLDNVAPVTKGQMIAPSVVAPATNFGSIALASFNDVSSFFPYNDINTAKNINNAACFALEYDDGSYDVVPGLYPYSVISSHTYNSGTATDRRGMRFKTSFKGRLAGMWLWTTINAAADFDVVFYASDGITDTTLLSFDGNHSAAASVGIHKLRFSTPATIEKDTYYRLVIIPTTTTNIVIYEAEVGDGATAAHMDALAGGQEMHWTTADGAPAAEGDWTQGANQRPFMGLWFDQLDDAVQTGGGGSTMFIPVE